MAATANVYSGGASEEVLERFLKANIRREAVVIATKVHGVMRDEPNGHGLSRKAISDEHEQQVDVPPNGPAKHDDSGRAVLCQ